MTDPTTLPWQAGQWQRVQHLRRQSRLPHALLINGPGGTGEALFAHALMQALLCTADVANAPCNACPACREYVAGTHADAIRIAPEEADKAIGVDRIRALVERLTLTSGRSGKVACIEPAEAMTQSAANSLLKTLEEPPGESTLLLVSARPARLPATVRSRCQRVTFGLPPRADALAWLQAQAGIEHAQYWLDRAGGAPLLAQSLAEAGLDEAPLLEALLSALDSGHIDRAALDAGAHVPLVRSVPVLIHAVEDMIRLRFADEAPLRLPHERRRLADTSARVDARALFAYLDSLKRSMPGPSGSLRADIQWHGLLADAAEAGRERAH